MLDVKVGLAEPAFDSDIREPSEDVRVDLPHVWCGITCTTLQGQIFEPHELLCVMGDSHDMHGILSNHGEARAVLMHNAHSGCLCGNSITLFGCFDGLTYALAGAEVKGKIDWRG